MRLKTFTAATMTQAMQLVRAEMGEHAVIMSTQQGKQGCTVTAGIDEDAVPRPSPVKPLTAQPAPAPATLPDPDLEILDTLAETFDRHGLSRRLSQKLLRLVNDEDETTATDILSDTLSRQFRFTDLTNAGHPKPCVIVGPPGAGKTVAIAKLATAAVMAGRKTVVITADTHKAGGVEQLANLTRILQVPLHTVEDAHALATAISHTPEEAAVFIDTPGINFFDPEEAAGLQALLGTEQFWRILAMPAGTDPVEAADIAAASAEILKTTLLLATRLDHARRLGGMLSATDAGGLALAGVTASASAAKPLLPLSPGQFAKMLLLPPSTPKINVLTAK